MQQLSGFDATFLYTETSNAHMAGAGLSIYDPSTAPGGAVSFKDILAHYEERLAEARVFRQRLVRVPGDLDHPYWIEDPDFDLEYHVRHIALPQPGDWRQLCIQTARLLSRPLDLERPLWETYVVEGLDNVEGVPRGCFALVSKVHHAAIDGMSGMAMTSAVHDLTPEGRAPTPDRWRPERIPSDNELLMRAMWNNTRKPMRAVRSIGKIVPQLGRLPGMVRRHEVELPPMSIPRTRFSAAVTPHRVFDAARFELDGFRRVRRGVEGATVNDVVLSVVGGALRRYLLDKDELPAEPLVGMAPISVRGEAEANAAGNLVSGMLVGLATDVADPKQRLLTVTEATKGSKEFAQAIGARTLVDMAEAVPGGLVGWAARTSARLSLANRMRPMFNASISNMPGPRVPLYFAGAELVSMYIAGMITAGMGLIHPVASYRDDLTISFTSDRTMMPDPAFYADCLRDAFEELDDAVRPSRPARPARSAVEPAATRSPVAKRSPARATKARAKQAPTKKAPTKKAAPKQAATSRKAAPKQAAASKKAAPKQATTTKTAPPRARRAG